MKTRRAEPVVAPELMAELQAAAAIPDSQIDMTDPDAPEVVDWSGAERGRFYKPVKTLKSIRIDADVLAYFQAQGKGYQTRINALLRASMLRGLKQTDKPTRKKAV